MAIKELDAPRLRQLGSSDNVVGARYNALRAYNKLTQTPSLHFWFGVQSTRAGLHYV